MNLSFNLFFAGSQNKLAEAYLMNNNCNRLLSYWSDKSIITKWVEFKKENPNCTNLLFIDCGAYTAFTQGITIDIDTYVNYINNIIDYVDIVASLDVIGDGVTPDTDEKTYENYLYLKEHIKCRHKLLPTFHQGDKIEYLIKYLEDKDIDYIALGGLVGSSKKDLCGFFDNCYSVIKKIRPDIKVHAFGMTSKPILEQYPFSSADSTGWIMTAANGSIMSKWGILNVSEKQKSEPDNFYSQCKEIQDEIKKYVESLGFTLEEVSSDYKPRTLVNIMYLKSFQDSHKPKLRTMNKKLF
jgi:hypothetical protein